MDWNTFVNGVADEIERNGPDEVIQRMIKMLSLIADGIQSGFEAEDPDTGVIVKVIHPED